MTVRVSMSEYILLIVQCLAGIIFVLPTNAVAKGTETIKMKFTAGLPTHLLPSCCSSD